MDLLYSVVKKMLGNRPPEDFVPELVPREIKSPTEVAAEMGKNFSVEDAAKAFIPVDVPKMVDDIADDMVRFAGSLTPENLAAGGEIDLPEPSLRPQDVLYHPESFPPKGLALPKPKLPKLPRPPTPDELFE